MGSTEKTLGSSPFPFRVEPCYFSFSFFFFLCVCLNALRKRYKASARQEK